MSKQPAVAIGLCRVRASGSRLYRTLRGVGLKGGFMLILGFVCHLLDDATVS